ncbi:MAG TPA: hypothetical protein VGV37_18960 [Aliidongia sp.]|uniref:hypothetical protein n=1 Tax=Aliidongia sp. TaxID=1914230 RepID=UPI002DDD0FB5|nr:hypothetical protein [Aliidongia sp.]HEV2676614.1 hypothetical protein [Aliidongia sp.]
MADLAAAAARLTRAVDRLETAMVDQRGRGAETRGRMAGELASAQAEFAQLTQRTEGLGDRLDGAIDLIKTALEA